MSKKKICLVLFSFLFANIFSSHLFGQEKTELSLNTNKIAFGIDLGFGVPLLDLADRFGNSGTIGLNFEVIKESNWVFGIDGKFIFGSTVKEDPLALLRNESGFIYGVDNQPAQIFLRERGAYLGARVGRFVPLDAKAQYNLKFSLGMGVLDHFIRYQDDSRSVGQIVGDYVSGYDRKSRGLALHQEILFQQFDPKNRLNYYFGVDIMQGFTKNIRPINFDTQTKDDSSRTDMYLNFKIGLSMFFISSSSKDDKIYY